MKRRIQCQACGATVHVPLASRVHFHRCEPPRVDRRRRVTLPELEVDRESARTAIWLGLEAALDDVAPDWQLRPSA